MTATRALALVDGRYAGITPAEVPSNGTANGFVLDGNGACCLPASCLFLFDRTPMDQILFETKQATIARSFVRLSIPRLIPCSKVLKGLPAKLVERNPCLD